MEDPLLCSACKSTVNAALWQPIMKIRHEAMPQSFQCIDQIMLIKAAAKLLDAATKIRKLKEYKIY